jgi:hypothetical protein
MGVRLGETIKHKYLCYKAVRSAVLKVQKAVRIEKRLNL